MKPNTNQIKIKYTRNHHKAIVNKIEKRVYPKYGAILSQHGKTSPVPSQNVSINAAAPVSRCKHL